ncbi:MAG: ATP-binding protein, partial [Rhodanobacter sp.]
MAIPGTQQSTSSRPSSWLANQPLQSKMMMAIGLLLGLFLIANIITMNSLRSQESSRRWATHTYQVIMQIDQTQHEAQAGQIAARGFLLSVSAEELEQFKKSTHNLTASMADLRKLVVDNPLQQARLDEAESIITGWEKELYANAIEPLQQLDPADPATEAERRQIRTQYMLHRSVHVEDLYVLLNRMSAEERRLLTQRNDQLQHHLRTIQAINALTILLSILLAITVLRLTSKLVIRPLRRLTGHMTRLSHHDHDFEIRRLERRDEVGEIARALQVFKQMSLDTDANTWVRSTASHISQMLLQATTHKEFGQWLTSELVPLCDAGLGLFYLFDDAGQQLDLMGSYGLRLSNPSANRYSPGEGLVGQCAVEHKAIFLDDVPDDYVHIESGSLDALPRHVAILPVLYRETLIGVLELAGFSPLTPLQRQLLDELLPLVALTLENLNQAVHTQRLLGQTKEQADELRVSELVMRQQKEVLRERNETLQAKTGELEEQSHKLIASEDELRLRAEELLSSNEELRDMTDSLNQQKHVLVGLQKETADKAAELARASQYKSEFLANMSHELRTPLNSLLILSRSLADNETGNLDDEQIESAHIIHDAGNSLLHLINDILDLSKVEAGKMELLIENLTIADLGMQLQRTFAHVAADKKLEFSISIEPGLPRVLATDGGKLVQIANNLLSNAFKFTASGSVTVHIGRPPSEMELPSALSGQRVLALTVCDTGIGIPQDKLERIFNAFEQVDASTSRQFGGTGLGLALSRRMAQLLGGDVVLQSEPGRGSRFT